jgi:ABC-type sugar transport system permease subunit
MVWTTVEALAAPTPAIGNFRDILTDPGALAAAGHSVLWVGIALLLIGIGYGIAVISRLIRNWRVLLSVLILPFGVSGLVSGAVFRMIFDPNPERGMAKELFVKVGEEQGEARCLQHLGSAALTDPRVAGQIHDGRPTPLTQQEAAAAALPLLTRAKQLRAGQPDTTLVDHYLALATDRLAS